MNEEHSNQDAIAIIGMAGRFPGARDVDEFWRNLQAGTESVTVFDDSELRGGAIGDDLLDDAGYVRASTVLHDVDHFDAAFFGVTAREASFMDPQHRLFLECCWEAFEKAGYVPERYPGAVGVYAGCSVNSYMMHNLASNPAYFCTPEGFQGLIGNDKDYLATRIAYKLDLRGPAITLQTACSTSLVAVHMACQGLRLGESDLALAGGVSVKVPQQAGYLYQEGMPFSKDGHCRAFDEEGTGTVFGSGMGVVLLKRLEDAVRDNDHILAVIRGSSINNDGAGKVGFTAPSSRGQADVIAQTLAVADIPAETITYVEAHGTGTPLGDPIEIEALKEVFAAETDKRGFCAVGSVKSNVGHLETASGITGLIKTVQMLRHKVLVPSLGYRKANPQIDFKNSPFYVNTELKPWRRVARDVPLRAAVSSFGMGGTNAHAILEEWDDDPKGGRGAGTLPCHLLAVSARTREALERATHGLATWLKENRDADLARVSATLLLGRKPFEHRRILVCSDPGEAAAALETAGHQGVLTHRARAERNLVFIFPGGGAQYPGMAAGLYRTLPSFAATVDECAEIAAPVLGFDLRTYLLADDGDEGAAVKMQEPEVMFPSLFTVQYAMSRVLHDFGIKPAAMVGHSNGEYVAACLAGVMSAAAALRLVAIRGKLMMKMRPGAMAVLPVDEERARALLGKNTLSIAAVNSPTNTVISGDRGAVMEFRAELERKHGIVAKDLHINAGLHSYLTNEIREEFEKAVAAERLGPPEVPYVSTVTGTWITGEEAVEPAFWGRHLCGSVRYAAAIRTVLARGEPPLLVDVGPNQVASALARQNGEGFAYDVVCCSRQYREPMVDSEQLLGALGRLWLLGAAPDWRALYNGGRPRTIPLPTYPFDRKRYWVEAPSHLGRALAVEMEPGESLPATDEQLPGRPSLMVEYVPPASDTEKRVAGLWQRYLGFSAIGALDNFIELGGTSLLATEVNRSLREEFCVDLDLNTFLSLGNVRAIAGHVERLEEEREQTLGAEVLAMVEHLDESRLAEMLRGNAGN